MRGITVGIPSYNERQNIVNLLRAIEEQHTPILEVLISDDSSDNTPSLVHNFAEHSLLDIQLFHHDTRRGAAAAWNEILQRAAGDIIVLYDADKLSAGPGSRHSWQGVCIHLKMAQICEASTAISVHGDGQGTCR
jgi:glycosyltransferase involved in cell wall biosynthesis